jgi:hypothetical protein
VEPTAKADGLIGETAIDDNVTEVVADVHDAMTTVKAVIIAIVKQSPINRSFFILISF